MPTLMVAAAVGVAALLVVLRGSPDHPVIEFLVPKTIDAAQTLLQVVIGSVITVTSVVFSLTVLALQISATNYSPRILRSFLRDLSTQIVLGTFLATFTYCLIVLQNIQDASAASVPHWTPQVAFSLVPIWVGMSLVALVYFIHHVAQSIRVERILQQVLEETLATIDRVYWVGRENLIQGNLDDVVPRDAQTIRARRDGFVQSVSPDALVGYLQEIGAQGALRPVVGDHVVAPSPLGWAWGGGACDEAAVMDALEQQFDDAVHFGAERTMQEDVAFGIRQMVDVAVRALSPGVNDPNTAVTVISLLGIVYSRLATRDLGHFVFGDEKAARRLIVPGPDLDEYLHIAMQQIAHYGRADAMVLLRLLRMLGDVKALAPPGRDDVFQRHVQRVIDEAEDAGRIDGDIEAVREAGKLAMSEAVVRRHSTQSG